MLQEIKEVKKIASRNSIDIGDINKTLGNVSSNVNKNSKILEKQSETLKKHDDQLDFLATTVVDIIGRLDTIDDSIDYLYKNSSTKDDISLVLNAIDAFAKRDLDRKQENVFLNYRVNENTKDISRIKPLVELN